MRTTCGAKTYSGQQCSLPLGHQTIHPGVGRCRFHEITDPTFPFKYTSKKIAKGFGICRDLSELKAFQGLDRNYRVKRYSIEPVVIPYTLGHIMHNYIPDLLVVYQDNTEKLIEIKSFSYKIDFIFTDKLIRTKLKAGITYANVRGIDFELWTYKVGTKIFEKVIFGRNELWEKLGGSDAPILFSLPNLLDGNP
jgi:hypothetical protein